MSREAVDSPEAVEPEPGLRRTPTQRRAFAAAFAGWLLDGYDYTVLTLVLLDVQRDLSIGPAAGGALGTVTLFALWRRCGRCSRLV